MKIICELYENRYQLCVNWYENYMKISMKLYVN